MCVEYTNTISSSSSSSAATAGIFLIILIMPVDPEGAIEIHTQCVLEHNRFGGWYTVNLIIKTVAVYRVLHQSCSSLQYGRMFRVLLLFSPKKLVKLSFSKKKKSGTKVLYKVFRFQNVAVSSQVTCVFENFFVLNIFLIFP